METNVEREIIMKIQIRCGICKKYLEIIDSNIDVCNILHLFIEPCSDEDCNRNNAQDNVEDALASIKSILYRYTDDVEDILARVKDIIN